MVEYFDLAATVVTSRFNVENITFIPISIIDFIQFVIARIKQVFGVHNIIEEWIDADVGGKVDDFDLDHLQYC